MHRFLSSVLGLLTVTASGLSLQASETAPKLVIGIHIDQLKSAYIDWFLNGFGEDGFKKVLHSGTIYKTMVYDYPKPDAVSACATFMTGCYPRQHGIPSQRWYDRKTKQIVSCVFDPQYIGNYTNETVSPGNLQCSTLGDELKVATAGESKVFSIGLSAEESVILGGHSADGVFWIDGNTGKWCTSTYYNYMPSWLQNINDTQNIAEVIEHTSWQPLLPLSYYHYMPYQKSPTLFQFLFNKYGKDKFHIFKQTPLANEEVCKLAVETIEKEGLGNDDNTDFLTLEMSASNGLEGSKDISALEIQDIYFRLDHEIGTIIAAADHQAGQGNVLVYIVGAGTPDYPAKDLPATKPYGGDFYPSRCVSLLNLYLMAIYGNENWVSTYCNQQIFLNQELIEKKGINYNEISSKAAAFLTEFSGVQSVIRNNQFLLGEYNSALNETANGVYPKHSGDLYIEIQGGWNIREDGTGADHQVRSEAYSTPFILYGANTKAQKISRQISVADVTATLSKVFRIRPPNSCKGQILSEFN